MRKILSVLIKTIDEKNHIGLFQKNDIVLPSLKFKIDEKPPTPLDTPKKKPSK